MGYRLRSKPRIKDGYNDFILHTDDDVAEFVESCPMPTPQTLAKMKNLMRIEVTTEDKKGNSLDG